ncbi:HORMA domain containing protein [Devosia marina]|uniref:HORMA domain containing protein n=1 Tax=Devosia marina TaxID=2683198 RepID=A0A7X3FQF1_9HYPH|nr:HORMA domain containing protein [Devosia marina]MVS98861.1 HORMA domain containing protein [Devosia marina]
MSAVTVNTYTHSVTYVADNILKSIKDIIVKSGLDPAGFFGDWDVLTRGLQTWLNSQHLERVVLEIFNPTTNALIHRWDIDIVYNWSGGGDGSFWTDTDALNYAIKKNGIPPSTAKYRIITTQKTGYPAVAGWSDTTYRSTEGMVRQSLGGTVDHNGLGGSTSYWRKA